MECIGLYPPLLSIIPNPQFRYDSVTVPLRFRYSSVTELDNDIDNDSDNDIDSDKDNDIDSDNDIDNDIFFIFSRFLYYII